MPTLKGLTARLTRLWRALLDVTMTHDQCMYLMDENRRLNEAVRLLQAGDALADASYRSPTKASFDFQWQEMPSGAALPSDESFMAGVGDTICGYTQLESDWFQGKRVADVGCGGGRFTLGLLGLGARVTAVDQSEAALDGMARLCSRYADNLTHQRVDLLEWDSVGDFDLVYCYGVVHHTGNTYLAIRNVARKVRPGGRLFLMVYGLPRVIGDLEELITYERLRQELRLCSLEQRAHILTERYGTARAHGYFDAVSPRINDLLSFEELAELLGVLGFENPRITFANRNIHMIADRLVT